MPKYTLLFTVMLHTIKICGAQSLNTREYLALLNSDNLPPSPALAKSDHRQPPPKDPSEGPILRWEEPESDTEDDFVHVNAEPEEGFLLVRKPK